MTDKGYTITRSGGPTLVPPKRRGFTLFKDIDPAPRKHWLIRDMLGAGELSFIYGAPGSGKSVVVADMAAHVAAGLDWRGKRVARGAVLYVAAERGALVKRRLAAWRKAHGVDDAALGVVCDAFDLWSSRADALEIVELAQALGAATGLPVSWIIVDTVAACLPGGDENSGKDMGQLAANLAHIQARTGAHVTGVHHVPHGDQSRMRGHGVLLGAADSTFSVEKDEASGLRFLQSRKANDGPNDVKIAFALESVELATDPETGDVTTAPIVVEAGNTGQFGQAGHARTVRLSDSEEIAKRALADAIEESGEAPPGRLLLPAGLRAVPEDVWRRYCYDRKISESDKPDTLRRNFARAAAGLQRKGVVGVREGLAWLT